MTNENNITITMQDVDVVRQVNPEFDKGLIVAAVSRMRAEMSQSIEKEATEKKDAKGIEALLTSESNCYRMVNVWASWCITCLVEHPFLSKLAESQIEIIVLDYKDDKTKALDWLKRYGNPYTSLIYDPRGDLAFDLGVTGAPETFLIVDQKIVGHIQGELNEDKWKSTFLPIIQNSQKELN